AAGMHAAFWPDGEGGGLFVLGGADTIAATAPDDSVGAPILRVTLDPGPYRLYSMTRLRVIDLEGSYFGGHQYRACPLPYSIGDETAARICSGITCDFDGDGSSDLEDFVAMADCLEDTVCSNHSTFDCDGSGRLALADVWCCATAGLRRRDLNPGTSAPPIPYAELAHVAGLEELRRILMGALPASPR